MDEKKASKRIEKRRQKRELAEKSKSQEKAAKLARAKLELRNASARRKQHLSFSSLLQSYADVLLGLSDTRQSRKVDYSIHDAMMCAFACMHFQDPSLLQFQKRLKLSRGTNNLETMFGVKKIPKPSQLVEIIDKQDSELFRPVFKELFARLQRGKHLEQFQVMPNTYAVSLDGAQYFGSKAIRCEQCLEAKHKKKNAKGEEEESITYSHKMVQAAMVNPKCPQVIPFMPEEISNIDGNTKQDCETNAGKRIIKKIRKDHPKLGIIITADSLFSKQPFILDLKEQGMSFMLVAKPKDHPYLTEWIENYDELNTFVHVDEKGKTHTYEWMNEVPLHGGKDAIDVNYVRYQITATTKSGELEIHYRNSWVTDLEIKSDNVEMLVKIGRAKWKVENECFNTLKNQGYCMEHNYGHGVDNACFNFLLSTMLAFFFHQIFELTDLFYQICRETHGAKQVLWQSLRTYIRIMIFNSSEELLAFAADPDGYQTSFVHNTS